MTVAAASTNISRSEWRHHGAEFGALLVTKEMMMNEEDLLPTPKTPRKLEEMSLEELEVFIAACETKIAEAHAMINAKHGARGDADRFFKK